MKITFYDTHGFERLFFEKENKFAKHEVNYIEPRLMLQTAPLAAGSECVCLVVNAFIVMVPF